MSAAKIIKLSPNVALVAFAAYATYALQASLPGAAEQRAELVKGIDVLIDEIASSDAATKLERAALRDPFRPVLPPAPPPVAAVAEAKAEEADRIAEVISGLELEATFVQGRDQLAIISGHTYSKGQRLAIPGDDDPPPELTLLFVKPTSVLLRGGGKVYSLSYPERLGMARERDENPEPTAADSAVLDPAGQAAMFPQLLNSPLGAMGKGLIGLPDRPGSGARRGARRKPSASR